MNFQEALLTTRERIIDRSLFTVIIFVFFAVFTSVLRAIDIGWQPVMYLHIFCFFLVLLLFLFRKKISLNVKTHGLFVLFMIIAVAGAINFRVTASSGVLIFPVVTISIIILGLWTGLMYSIVFLVLYIIVAILHINNVFNLNLDFNIISNLPKTWISMITGYFFSLAITVDSLVLYYNFYIKHLKELHEKSSELSETNKQLVNATKRYRSLFDGSKDGIVFVDKDRKITDCNKSHLELLGYELSDLVGKDYKIRLSDTKTNWDDFFQKAASDSGSSSSVECVTTHKNGQLIPIEVTPYIVESEDDYFNWAVVRDLREKKRHENEIYSTMITAEEKERERYAKELHDGLGPLLSTGLIYINAIGEENDSNTIKEYSQRAYTIIKDATSVVKEISNNLSPVILTEYGITHAIRAFIEKAQFATKIQFKIVDNNTNRFASIIEFTLYRTIVELLNNSIKYSDASNVIISFYYENNTFSALYTDNGVGFDYPEALKSKQGFGLLNMENRIRKIGGMYQYKTAPGKGVEVSILLKESCI